MKSLEEDARIYYRITPSKESVPQASDALHDCGLTCWHMLVLRVEEISPPNENGTMCVQMRVRRTEIGKEHRPCPLRGATRWIMNARVGT